MNGTKQMSWSARLLIGLVLIIIGAGAATWGLAHYQPAAKFLGVVPAARPEALLTPKPIVLNPDAQAPTATQAPSADARVSALETRLARVENATERAEGFAGRADALVVAFAARRAIDRGVALANEHGRLACLADPRRGCDDAPGEGEVIEFRWRADRLPLVLGSREHRTEREAEYR